MSAQVTARSRRPLSFGMFSAMLPDAAVLNFAQATGRQVIVTFDRDLTAEEAEAVTERIESTDDADMATRAALRALAVAVEAMPTTPMRALLLSLTTRVLDA